MKPSSSANLSSDPLMNAKRIDNRLIDKLGVWVSALCAVHCLALPLLLPIAPIIAASIFADAWFEVTILAFSMLIGFAALLIGFFQYHRQLYPIYSLLAGGLIYWQKDIFGEAFEPLTIAIGASFIIIAHVLNLKLCKSCRDC